MSDKAYHECAVSNRVLSIVQLRYCGSDVSGWKAKAIEVAAAGDEVAGCLLVQ